MNEDLLTIFLELTPRERSIFLKQTQIQRMPELHRALSHLDETINQAAGNFST